MPPDDHPTPGPTPREPLSPAKRKRLQKIFEHGSKMMAQSNHDYATELFAQCVIGDPGNLIYIQNYLGNLQKKYNNNKSGSKLAQFKERGARGAVKKAVSQSVWDDVIANGLRVLTVNPWDVPTLTAMAVAAENLGDDECELYYLKCALEANPKDPDVNRQCAMALAARQQFDQAIACWHRVQQARPDDEDAQRAIASLAVEKTIKKGGYDEADQSKKLARDRAGHPSQTQEELTLEERLRRRIQRDPEDVSAYRELAQLHENNEDYEAAVQVWAKVYDISGGDPDVRERWQDAEIRHLRQQIAKTQDDETRARLTREFNAKDLAVHQDRCERYPSNLGFRFDLGLRYQRVEQYNEAIRQFQQARNDPSRKGRCLLHLGQCFQHIKQYRLAMSHYESAIAEIPERDENYKKEALYRAGKLGVALRDFDTAERHLTTLAEVDFTYKDVSTLLDKISELRQNN